MSNSNIWPTSSAAVDPRGKVSIGPGSTALEWKEKLRNGTTVFIRSIQPGDAEIERRFISELSEESRRFRFLGSMSEPPAELVEQLTHPDPHRDLALVALIADGARKREIGVARFSARADGCTCECAVAVSDDWHNQGLATLLMQHLIDVARQRGIECMYSVDAADNEAMRDLAQHLGFTRKPDPSDVAQVLHTLDLKAAAV